MNITEMLTYEEFNKLTDEEKKEKLTLYRNMFTNKEIMTNWNINTAKLYSLINKHQLPKAARGGRKQAVQNAPKKNVNPNRKVDTYIVKEDHLPVPYNANDAVNGIALMIKGTYSAEKLIHRLERTVFMLLDEEADFEIDLKIKEKL